MILDPHELRRLSYEVDTPAGAVFEHKLEELHNKHLINNHHVIMIPQYWCETVFYGLQEMIEEFPQITLGNILQRKNRLVISTIPSTTRIEEMKIRLYCKIDTLILETIENLLQSPRKPFFAR